MKEAAPETALPEALLRRASIDGGYAWPVEDIPDVIIAACDANLVNLGGRLQFRLPTETCECQDVAIDVEWELDPRLPWADQVRQSAEIALREFAALQSRVDFVAEGHREFGDHLPKLLPEGRRLEDFIVFAWSLQRAPSRGADIGPQLPAQLGVAAAVLGSIAGFGAGVHLFAAPIGVAIALGLAHGATAGLTTWRLLKLPTSAPILRDYAPVWGVLSCAACVGGAAWASNADRDIQATLVVLMHLCVSWAGPAFALRIPPERS